MSWKSTFVLVALPALSCSAAVTPAYSQMPELRNYSGEVVVQSVDDERIVIAVDTSNEGRPADGIADSVFWFTPEERLAEPVSMRLPFANVEARPRRLVISSPEEGRVLSLALAPWIDAAAMDREERPRQAPRASRSEGAGLQLERGIELAEYRGGYRIRMEELAAGESGLRATQLPAIGDIDNQDLTGGGGGGCSSGGPGSTSCSTSCSGGSCSTSCGSTTFACCNCTSAGATCKCKL